MPGVHTDWASASLKQRTECLTPHTPRRGVSSCRQQHTWVWTEESRGPRECLRESRCRGEPKWPAARGPAETQSHMGRWAWGVRTDRRAGEHALWVQTTGGPPKPSRRVHTQPTSYSSPRGSGQTIWWRSGHICVAIRSLSHVRFFGPIDGNTPGSSVLHYLPEFTKLIWVHRVKNAIQPSHPLSPLLLLPSVFPTIRVFSSERTASSKSGIWSENFPEPWLHESALDRRQLWLKMRFFGGSEASVLAILTRGLSLRPSELALGQQGHSLQGLRTHFSSTRGTKSHSDSRTSTVWCPSSWNLNRQSRAAHWGGTGWCPGGQSLERPGRWASTVGAGPLRLRGPVVFGPACQVLFQIKVLMSPKRHHHPPDVRQHWGWGQSRWCLSYAQSQSSTKCFPERTRKHEACVTSAASLAALQPRCVSTGEPSVTLRLVKARGTCRQRARARGGGWWEFPVPQAGGQGGNTHLELSSWTTPWALGLGGSRSESMSLGGGPGRQGRSPSSRAASSRTPSSSGLTLPYSKLPHTFPL